MAQPAVQRMPNDGPLLIEIDTDMNTDKDFELEEDKKRLRAEAIRRQVEYYFSDRNLRRDDFLFDKMNGRENEPVPLDLIHTFPKMRMWQPVSMVVDALKTSRRVKLVEHRGEDCIVRRQPFGQLYYGEAEEDGVHPGTDMEVNKDNPSARSSVFAPKLMNGWSTRNEDATVAPIRHGLQNVKIESNASQHEAAMMEATRAGKGEVEMVGSRVRFVRAIGGGWKEGGRRSFAGESLLKSEKGRAQKPVSRLAGNAPAFAECTDHLAFAVASELPVLQFERIVLLSDCPANSTSGAIGDRYRPRKHSIAPYAPGQGGLHGSRYARQAGQPIMADYEPRRDHYRGGGGYGGRKRRRDDDDDMRPQRPYQRREPPSAKVRRQLLAIAENPMSRPEEDVVNIAKSITDNYQDERFRDIISDLIVTLVQEQPFKIPFVAASILYANRDKPEFLNLIITKTGAQIQTALETTQWRSMKLLLRFLGSLQDALEGDGVFALLDELFSRAADLQAASSEDALGLELVKIIMLTIPYILASSVTSQWKEKAAELLEKTDIIASAPRDTESIVDPYVRTEGKEAPEPLSVLGLLQKQLQNEAAQDWPMAFIPRLFKPEAKEDDLIDLGVSAGQNHPLPEITFPQPLSPGPHPLFPELYFSVYADQDVETVPATSNIAASLIRDACVDTINILDFNRNSAAKYLVEIDCYYARGTFVRRATPLDKIKDLPEGSATWKPEDLAVDAIFSQMIQLPAPEHKPVYYHSLITETCKIAPGAIAPSLGRAIRFLYRNMDVLDEELGYRFVDWFSHHLSNFDFRWKWQEWTGDVEADLLNPRKSFIVGAIDKEMRLSFAKRIRQTVPEEYQQLIPASKDNDIPEYKYNNEVHPFSAEAKPLVDLLRKKRPEAELDEQLEKISTKASEPESEPGLSPEVAVVDAFVTTLCYIGSKTTSHVLSFIERHCERLVTLGSTSPAARAQIITAVVEYWKDTQPGVAVNIVDKLLNYTILTPASVVEWALAPERLQGGRLLAEAWIYEMVSRTCNKVTGRVRQIVNARLQPDIRRSQAELLESTLVAERENMRALFATLDDALVAVADGSADQVLQGGPGMMEPSEEERVLLRLWGVKWRRVFARYFAVEESIVVEGTKGFPVAGEDEVVEEKANGVSGDMDVDGMKGEGGTEGVNGAAVDVNGGMDIAKGEDDLIS